ncbi:MAG: hypothetical protein ACK56I_20045, partial [bacterium]
MAAVGRGQPGTNGPRLAFANQTGWARASAKDRQDPQPAGLWLVEDKVVARSYRLLRGHGITVRKTIGTRIA